MVTLVRVDESNRVSVGALLMAFFKSITARSASGVQENFFRAEVRSKRGEARVAAWGTKALYYITRPKKDCTCLALTKGV